MLVSGICMYIAGKNEVAPGIILTLVSTCMIAWFFSPERAKRIAIQRKARRKRAEYIRMKREREKYSKRARKAA